MVSTYHLNPYVITGNVISSDPFWLLAYWRDVTTHYGPVFTILSAGLAWLGGPSVLATALLFKLAAAACNLANALLVWRLSRELTGRDGILPLLLYAWNPLILIESAGSGHNDVIMMTLALLGLLLAVRGRPYWGLALLVLSVFVKYTTGLLVLFFILHYVARRESWRRLGGMLTRMAALAAGLTFALFLPFWAGPQSLERLAAEGMPFKTAARFGMRLLVQSAAKSWTGFEMREPLAEQYAIAILYAIFVLVLLWEIKPFLMSRPDWTRVLTAWELTGIVYVIAIYSWNYPWYLVPVLATATILPQVRGNHGIVIVSMILGFILMLLYGRLIPMVSS